MATDMKAPNFIQVEQVEQLPSERFKCPMRYASGSTISYPRWWN